MEVVEVGDSARTGQLDLMRKRFGIRKRWCLRC